MEDNSIIITMLKEKNKLLEDEVKTLKERLSKYTKQTNSGKKYYEKNKDKILENRKK
jgi:hypothetical protein